MSLWGDILNDAFSKAGIYAIGEPVPAAEQQFAARELVRLLDWMAARRAYCYTTTFAAYTLTAGNSPTQIGPGLAAPGFATPNGVARPLRIESASLILTDSTPNTDTPIAIRDAAWWHGTRVKSLESNVPTDLYYEPDWPNGDLYFWPVPNFNYGVRLEMWVPAAAFPVDTSGNYNLKAAFSQPEGFEQGIVSMLAGKLCIGYRRPITQDLATEIRESRAAMISQALVSPEVSSADIGVSPSSRSRGGSFNYYSGGPA